jgi:hypothetical protein
VARGDESVANPSVLVRSMRFSSRARVSVPLTCEQARTGIEGKMVSPRANEIRERVCFKVKKTYVGL